MATGRRRAAAEETPSRKPTPIHEGLSAFIENETGNKVSAKAVQLVLSLNGAYHDSDEYADALAAVEEAREAREQAKVDARNARKQAQADKLRAKLAAVLGEAEDEPSVRRARRPAPAKRTARRPAKAGRRPAARRARPADDEEVSAPTRRAPVKRGRARKSTAAPTANRGALRVAPAADVDDVPDDQLDVEEY
jgi:hypothetical protein